MSFDLQSFIGSNVGSFVDKIIHAVKADPTVVAQNAADIEKAKIELQGVIETATQSEIAASAEIIKAEANSQSWLPRNVRPLLLLFWGSAITFNVLLPIVGHIWGSNVQPIPVDPWVYKLTAIGFTGYVTARTWEKVTNSDN
jgi:hypothetical protein